MDPSVVFIVTIFVLSVAAGGWVLGTIRQMKIREEEMIIATKALNECSKDLFTYQRRLAEDSGTIVEAKQIIKVVKKTKAAYNELPLELKTRIDLFLKRRK